MKVARLLLLEVGKVGLWQVFYPMLLDTAGFSKMVQWQGEVLSEKSEGKSGLLLVSWQGYKARLGFASKQKLWLVCYCLFMAEK
jgi:hypothetical protein